jgi:ABC-2 type transport system ATP-binding protein
MVAGEVLALGSPADIKRRAQSASVPEPSMEDAFIHVIQSKSREGETLT